MEIDLFGTNSINSTDDLAERRALVRALMARQVGQRPRDTWDGINSLVAALGGRVAQTQLDKVETAGQATADASFAPLIEALRKKQTPNDGMLTGILADPWPDPRQRSTVQDLFKQQLKVRSPSVS